MELLVCGCLMDYRQPEEKISPYESKTLGELREILELAASGNAGLRADPGNLLHSVSSLQGSIFCILVQKKGKKDMNSVLQLLLFTS